ncbi:MAG: bifunctional acetate--CoA ligase family protein/GNAT family N-acetyltransferase [Stappiaceae bacterium]
MTIRNLDAVINPTSVGVIGPNRLPDAVFSLLVGHLTGAGYRGLISFCECLPPKSDPSFPCVTFDELASGPDLAIITSGPETAAQTVQKLGETGTRAVLFPSAGYESWPEDTVLAILQAARAHNVRIVGPGSLGIATPRINLQASLTPLPVPAGDMALITRSATLTSTIVSWGANHGIGFSTVVTLGQKADVDIGDLLDWFALEYRTKAIFVHLEAVNASRKFLSAARIAARSKPVVVIRSGISRDTQKWGQTHAGHLAVPDVVYDAALRRAGVLRVDEIDQLFEAAEIVTRVKPPIGHRLAIIANGRTLATIAADQLVSEGGAVATLSPETSDVLSRFARNGTSESSPCVLSETSSAQDYRDVLSCLYRDKNVDGILVIAAPSALMDQQEIATAISDTIRAERKQYGGRKVLMAALPEIGAKTRKTFESARVPCHASPAEAIRSFMYLARYANAQKRLMDIPASLPENFKVDANAAKQLVSSAMNKERDILDPEEVSAILSAYDIPHLETLLLSSPKAAERTAETLLQRKNCESVAIKISSPDLPFKTDVGGVALDLRTPQAVGIAARAMLSSVRMLHPEARISGIVVQPMAQSGYGIELYLGLADNPVFGPVVVFGHGGNSVEVMRDTAFELVPLDLNLAGYQIQGTRVSALMDGYRGHPAVDRTAVAQTLVKLSQLAIDIPEIRELDINPLIATPDGVLAVDGRITIGPPQKVSNHFSSSHLAIRPYPKEWERNLPLKNGTSVGARPVRPEDEGLFQQFFSKISPEDLRLRFFAPVKEFTHAFLARLTQLDYARSMAFIALEPKTGEMLGAVRLHADPDYRTGEYAILVKSGLKGTGLGWALMQLIIDYANSEGIQTIKGEVLRENTTMLNMCTALGFQMDPSEGDEAIIEVTLDVSTAKDSKRA